MTISHVYGDNEAWLARLNTVLSVRNRKILSGGDLVEFLPVFRHRCDSPFLPEVIDKHGSCYNEHSRVCVNMYWNGKLTMEVDCTNIDSGEGVERDEHDMEQEVRDGRHDPTAIPDCMETLDGHTQKELLEALYTSTEEGDADHLERFKDMTAKRTKLSVLRRLVERQDSKMAMSLLQKRRMLDVDEEYLLDLRLPDVTPRFGPHFVDFTLYVGEGIGFGPVLPLREHDPTWTMQLSFNHANDLFPKADARHLPFDAKGRMLKIGTRLQENIWLAMVPRTYVEQDHKDNVPGNYPVLNATTTALKTRHHLMVTMFFAFVLAEMRFRDLHCVDRYPEPLTKESVDQSTEIL